MPKRKKLDFNTDELAKNLEESKGKGVDALFSQPSPTPPEEAKKESPPKEDISTQTRKRARTHARTKVKKIESPKPEESVHARTHFPIERDLKNSILSKKHLSSFTFRFRPDELDELDEAAGKVNKSREQKVSKNDIVRLGLNWLLKDYKRNKGKSMLARVLRSTQT